MSLSNAVQSAPSNQLPSDLQRDFILAGNAKVVFTSLVTGRSFTYRVKQSKDDKNLFFVSCYDADAYQYVGVIKNKVFKSTSKTQIDIARPEVQGFRYVFNKLMAGENTGVIISHAGKCGKCARELTDPQSIETGFGPICHPRPAKKVSKRKLKVVAGPAPAPTENNIIQLPVCTDCKEVKPIYHTQKISSKLTIKVCENCFDLGEYHSGSSIA